MRGGWSNVEPKLNSICQERSWELPAAQKWRWIDFWKRKLKLWEARQPPRETKVPLTWEAPADLCRSPVDTAFTVSAMLHPASQAAALIEDSTDKVVNLKVLSRGSEAPGFRFLVSRPCSSHSRARPRMPNALKVVGIKHVADNLLHACLQQTTL